MIKSTHLYSNHSLIISKVQIQQDATPSLGPIVVRVCCPRSIFMISSSYVVQLQNEVPFHTPQNMGPNSLLKQTYLDSNMNTMGKKRTSWSEICETSVATYDLRARVEGSLRIFRCSKEATDGREVVKQTGLSCQILENVQLFKKVSNIFFICTFKVIIHSNHF